MRIVKAMDEKKIDLSSLRIDRTESPQFSRKPRLTRKIVIAAAAVFLLAAGAFLLKPVLFPGIEVRLAPASYSSPAQAMRDQRNVRARRSVSLISETKPRPWGVCVTWSS